MAVGERHLTNKFFIKKYNSTLTFALGGLCDGTSVLLSKEGLLLSSRKGENTMFSEYVLFPLTTEAVASLCRQPRRELRLLIREFE